MVTPGRRRGVDQQFTADEVGAVVALKPSATAKSRLDLPLALRQRLARSMALDTLAALTEIVAALIVVSDDPTLRATLSDAGMRADTLPEPHPGGMNRALTSGDERLRESGLQRVLGCVGDLPALRPASIRTIIAAANDHHPLVPARHFVPDSSGYGTTMLLATQSPLDPHFGAASAAAHRASGAIELTDAMLHCPVPEARADVDVISDLDTVLRLGPGRATTAVIDSGMIGRQTNRHTG